MINRIFKILVVSILLFALCVNVASCLSKSEDDYAILCAHFAVPVVLVMDYHLYRGYDLLEKDDFGRVLCEVEGLRGYSAVVIMQKYDNDSVYYIEDFCYHIGSYSEEDLEKLKEQNQWNKEFDYTAITSKKTNKLFGDLDPNQIQNILCRKLDIDDQQVVDRWCAEYDGKGQELYFFVVEKNETQQSYLVFSDLTYTISYLEIPSEDFPTAQKLAAFKKDSGWVYDTVE